MVRAGKTGLKRTRVGSMVGPRARPAVARGEVEVIGDPVQTRSTRSVNFPPVFIELYARSVDGRATTKETSGEDSNICAPPPWVGIGEHGFKQTGNVELGQL